MPPRGRPTGPTPQAEALIVRHGPVFDHFAHRWCLKAELPDGTQATTIFDLDPGLSTAHLHPAAIPTYSVVLTRTDTVRLTAVCHTQGRTATFTSTGTRLTVTHAPDGITMTSATRNHQLTLTYHHHTATALAVITGELADRMPITHHKAVS
ncbi:hypothetical protein [Actinokineospora terrae]|uniref:Uncharacterized protein n=1 Tax=Actinokineospora terrae TaxID=155974 RepID=A0A1H9W0L0_9PSEU|nr:hypothetical protein [Actinokineospora terrae]SES27319.1 hypothetical protein SAMN04487818_109240 [Actinokineospora terrae]